VEFTMLETGMTGDMLPALPTAAALRRMPGIDAE